MNEIRNGWLRKFAGWHPVLQVLLVAVTGIALAARSRIGFIQISVAVLAPLLVQISGAVIALSWPAAQLASHWVEKANQLLSRALQYGEDHDDVDFEQLRGTFEELRDSLAPAMRGIQFAIAAFFSAISAILLPATELQAGLLRVTVNDLAVSIALSNLTLSIFLFLPTALYAFRLKAVEASLQSINLLQSHSSPPERDSGGPEEPPESGIRDGAQLTE